MKKGNNNILAFYHSLEWKKKRAEILARDNNECQKCKKKGRVTKANAVHHIKHYRTHKHLALENSNLISLCNACHNEEHPEKFNNGDNAEDIHEERFE